MASMEGHGPAEPPGDGDLDPEFRLAETAGQANEWALVLSAAGIPSRVVRTSHGYALQVYRADEGRAEAELQAHADESAAAEAARARETSTALARVGGAAPTNVALLVSLAMLLFYGVTGPSRSGSVWFTEGVADATWIRAGELWRSLTALTLHADATHLVGNLIFGTLFLTAVGRSLGPGVGLGLVVLSGAGGNLVNAFLRSTAHVSFGASTAVFGAVGVLAGFAIVRRAQRRDRWRRVLVPFAGGLGILAMIGSGEGRVDVFAHLFGLLCGVTLGAGVGVAMQKPPSAWVQVSAASVALAALVGSWWLALD